MKICKLGEVFKTTSGGTPSRNNPNYYNGNIPWVKSGELESNVILDTEEKITEGAIKNSSAKIFPKGTLLIALYGATIGKLARLGIDAATNQAVCGIYEHEEHDIKYLYWFLFHKRRDLIKAGIGGAQPNISQTILKNLEIALPNKVKQQAIVSKIEELFSELDKSIETLRLAQQQLKTYRQAVLKWAFEGKLTEEWRKENGTTVRVPAGSQKVLEVPTGFEPELIAAEPLTGYQVISNNIELPESWKWVKLGDVCTNVEYGSATKSKESGKIPVLRMGNIQKGRFDWEDLVYTDDDEEIDKYLLKKNDVLFNRTNSAELVGKTAIYKGERPAIFAGYLIRINRIELFIDADYLTYYLNTHAARQYGNSVRSFGVNQSNINGTKLKTYPIPLAPLKEQEQIVIELETRFSVADKMQEGIIQSLQQAEALRQSILKKAFEGKLV